MTDRYHFRIQSYFLDRLIVNLPTKYVLRITPELSACPLHTVSGCGKERRILIDPW